MIRPMLFALLLALPLAAPAVASSWTAAPPPPVVRKVRGIVARVEALAGAPASRVWVLVLEDLEGEGARWLRLRVPGRRDGDHVVAVPGVPLPRPGARMILTVRQADGDDWLLSRPDDWRGLRPGERP